MDLVLAVHLFQQVSGLLLGVGNSFLQVFLLYNIFNIGFYQKIVYILKLYLILNEMMIFTDGTHRTLSYTTDVILALIFLSFSCLLIANAYDRHRELAVYWLLGIILVTCNQNQINFLMRVC